MATTESIKSEPSSERSNAQFPFRLHELLCEVEKNGNESIISWIPGSNAFKVHNKQRFTNEILPAYFNATKYKSFQRNLNLWGFETIQEGPNKGGCFHRLFIKDDREKCHYMSRQKVKGSQAKQLAALAAEACNSASAAFSGAQRNDVASLSALADLASQANNTGVGTSVNKAGTTIKSSKIDDLKALSFPLKLHHILARPEFADAICWTPDGRCVRCVDPFRFSEKVAPLYFVSNSFSSFLIELEAFGFQKVAHAGFQECYYHDLLIRACPHLSKYMQNAQNSRSYRSDDPKRDLEVDQAFGTPTFQTASSPSSALSHMMGPNATSVQGMLPSDGATAGTLVQELQQRQQLAALQILAGSGAGPAGAGLGAALGLGGLGGTGLLGGVAAAAARRASLPTALGLGPPTQKGPLGGKNATSSGLPERRTSSTKLPISSFLANSSQNGGLPPVSRSEEV